MLQPGSRLKIADNTGAKIVMVLGIPGAKTNFARIGDVVRVSVKKAAPHGLVEAHSKHLVVVVRTRKEFRRADGSYIRFDDNAGVVLDGEDTKLPKGTRIFGPIARELKDLGYDKITSLAPELL